MREALEQALRGRKLAFDEITIGDSSDHAPFDGRRDLRPAASTRARRSARARARPARTAAAPAAPLDPCYHRRCDTLDRVDEKVLARAGRRRRQGARRDRLARVRGDAAAAEGHAGAPAPRRPGRRGLPRAAGRRGDRRRSRRRRGARAGRAARGKHGRRHRRAPPRSGRREKLSLRRQAGQLVVMRFNGPGPPAYVPRALRAGRAAGVILFKDNIASRADLKRARPHAAARGGRLGAREHRPGGRRDPQPARGRGPSRARPRRRRPRARPPTPAARRATCARPGSTSTSPRSATSRRAPAR